MSDFTTPSHQREFRCKHCDGKILIPVDLPPTTGPCPHCHQEITSPPPPGMQPPAGTGFQKGPAEQPMRNPAPAPPVRHGEPQPQERPQPAAQRSTAPAGPQPQEPSPTPAPAGRRKAAPAQRRTLIPAMLVLLVLILAAGGAIFFITQQMGRSIEGPVTGAVRNQAASEAEYLKSGWEDEARQVLEDFITGESAEEKIPHILNGPALAQRLDEFYGGSVIDDSDTPANAFTPYDLSMEDRRDKGIFLMTYERPPQFDMKEFFRPLASLEVQYGVDEADILLSYIARAGNFTMEPVRAYAFFKRTPAGLKLDWEVFAQTKYRTFQNFVELPEPGRTGVFRVLMVEDVPDRNAPASVRTYRMIDPANKEDTGRVKVNVDSEIGRTLSVINWRGSKDDSQPIARTATIELTWTEGAQPELTISRFICWEFLGLGGEPAPATASTR